MDHDELLDRAIELASQIADWPPLALRVSKRVLQHNVESDLGDMLRYELTSLSYGNRAVNDRRESLAAFRERRKPTFTGT